MMWSIKKAGRSRVAVALAALSLMLIAGACSRSNKSTAGDTRGSIQNRDTTSAPANINNTTTDNNYNGTNTTPGATDNTASQWQSDWSDFRNEVDKKVADNDKLINQKRADLANMKGTTAMRSEFQKIVDDAESRNHELQQKVADYHYQNDQAWGTFKDEIRNALDAVAASLNKIDVKK